MGTSKAARRDCLKADVRVVARAGSWVSSSVIRPVAQRVDVKVVRKVVLKAELMAAHWGTWTVHC
jgi:hypothetical protein